MSGAAAALSLCGASLFSLAAYVHSLRNSRSNTHALWEATPPSSVEDIRERIAAQEARQHGKGGGGGGSAAVFCKIVGETWAPASSLVPDRFGKPQVLVVTEMVEKISRCSIQQLNIERIDCLLLPHHPHPSSRKHPSPHPSMQNSCPLAAAAAPSTHCLCPGMQ